MRHYSPSPTVRSLAVPMYQRGAALHGVWALGELGQDPTENLAISPDGTIGQDMTTGDVFDLTTGQLIYAGGSPGEFTPQGPIASPQDLATAEAVAQHDAAINAAPAQAPPSAASSSVLNSAIATGATVARQLTSASSSGASRVNLPLGPSPRVSTLPGTSASSFLNQQAIGGIPNAFLIGGVLLMAAVLGSKR